MTGTQDTATADLQSINAALRQQLAERDAENRALLARQAASIEVLRAISASPDDPQPVFELIHRHARALCNARAGNLVEFDGTLMHQRLLVGFDPEATARLRAVFPRPPGPETVPGRAVLSGRIVHVPDAQADLGLIAHGRGLGARAFLNVPLLREGRVIGVLGLERFEPGEFDQSAIELVQSFAEQAVIAIAGAATLRELRERTAELQESLEYQAATSDVLKVISRSTFDLQQVLETLLATAARLCDADFAIVSNREAEAYRVAATFATSSEFTAFYRGLLIPADRGSITGRTAVEGQVVHFEDVASDPEFTLTETITLGGARTGLGVPLLREGVVIGVIGLARRRVEPFTDRQIGLVSTFADQAVIAMENVRLLTETREALEQQIATAEVLQVINASPGDLAPVFHAMLEKAMRLCDAAFGILWLTEGEDARAVALGNVPPALADYYGDRPHHAGPTTLVGKTARTMAPVQVTDARADEAYLSGDPLRRASVDLGNIRTLLGVPLIHKGRSIGVLALFRQEVLLFSDKQIALLQSFAAQAVIAMENARLINETQEALEQQTATAEVLQVINASPGNLTPVFDSMLERAMRLCGAACGGLFTYDGKQYHTVATRGVPAALAEYRRENPPEPVRVSGNLRLLETRRSDQVLDRMAEEDYRRGDPGARAMVELGGARTLLNVPLLKDDQVCGFFSFFRTEVRAFSDRQIALLENFAAQAVIAIEGARLITEQREALERQTATAEVLQVINASQGNIQPVFDAMLEKAMRLCDVSFGMFNIHDGASFRTVVTRGVPAAFAAFRASHPPAPSAGSPFGRAVETRRLVHVVDWLEEPVYKGGTPSGRAIADLGGARTVLNVPLVKEDAVLGVISFYRQEVRAFSNKQIALLENFAAQAVIAMENARLLNELRARTDELAQRQNELRVTFENMGDGVAMFDETPRLVAWNRKFQDILDLPDGVLAERLTFDDYIRYLAGRGEFGADADPDAQIRRLSENAGQHYALERTRPGGRVIEVRHNPVASGGFVLIYADITERKRNEAEIAAARDAAQEATRTIEAAFRDLKTAQANLIQAEKMASLGQLTAGIAHEIKNPLNFVNNFAVLSVELLAELKETAAPGFATLTEDQRAEIDDVSAMLTGNLQKITEHGKRADGIVKAMLEHSRGASGERRTVDINALVDEALNLAYHGARAQDQTFNITLQRDFAASIAPIEVNPQDITRVFLNLFSNGFYAANKRAHDNAPAGFQPTLAVATRDLGDHVEIQVRDNGTGIPETIRDKLFEPFFTTKPTGEGTGLGLSITYDIVTKQHGGTIAVESQVGDHTAFSIGLPRRMFAAEGAAA